MPSPLIPRRAIVRPRAVSPGSGEVLPLEDIIASLRERHRHGLIQIVGGPGSGKTTALEHLAAVLPDAGSAIFVDGPASKDPSNLSRLQFVIRTRGVGDRNEDSRPVAKCVLAGWGPDEWVEYLWSSHRSDCASVMKRLRADRKTSSLLWIPQLWRPVLDIMASDESLPTAEAALTRLIDEALVDDPSPVELTGVAFGLVTLHAMISLSSMLDLLKHEHAAQSQSLFRHEPVRLILAAFAVANSFYSQDGTLEGLLTRRWPGPLVENAARWISEDVQGRLEGILDSTSTDQHAIAASLVFARNPRWRPSDGRMHRLPYGHFRRARWSACNLSRSLCSGIDLHWADLAGASLERARLQIAKLSHANLQKARLSHCDATRADLSDADLTGCHANHASFCVANLTGACFEGAVLSSADFEKANLTGARFEGADLTEADLTLATLHGVNFSNACCDRANFHRTVLEDVVFSNASFVAARFTDCRLEGVDLSGLNFAQARLDRALLSGSRAHRASFRGACFRSAGLAEIDWEGADLSDTDLRDCSFHFGSTRSGLVGSPIACEGSRTRFYTDDYDEQGFKSPEEIRKANLCGCDLRGARIEGVDFYLVDLRGARYTADQERQFRQCGAILECPCDEHG